LPRGSVVKVLCLPAYDESDEIAAIMLAQLLEARGYQAASVSVEQLASEMVSTVQSHQTDLVCVSSLPPAAIRHVRYLCKRLCGNIPGVAMLIGLWDFEGNAADAKERIGCPPDVQVCTSFRDALKQAHELAQPKILAVARQG
jgi:hypothetical protein